MAKRLAFVLLGFFLVFAWGLSYAQAEGVGYVGLWQYEVKKKDPT